MRPSWHTATSGRGGPTRRPGSARQEAGLPQADRAVVGPADCAGGGPGTTTCKPSATRSPGRRRRSGSGAGSRPWRKAGSFAGLRAGWRDDGHSPERRPRPSSRPGRPRRPRRPSPTPPRRPRGPGRRRSAGRRGRTTWRWRAVEAGRRAGVGAAERGPAAPGEVRPADGDGRGDQGLPGAPSPLRPPAAALNQLTPPEHHNRPARSSRLRFLSGWAAVVEHSDTSGRGARGGGLVSWGILPGHQPLGVSRPVRGRRGSTGP